MNDSERSSGVDALPFGRLRYLEVPHAIGYAKFRSRSCDAVIRVYDERGNMIETHEQKAIRRLLGQRRLRTRTLPADRRNSKTARKS